MKWKSKYAHHLLINGERFFLSKDPFVYAEEAVAKYWPEKVENLANELAWKEYIQGKTEPSSERQLKFSAARMLAPHFLADERFVEFFKQDGGELIPEIKEICLFPQKHDELEERSIS